MSDPEGSFREQIENRVESFASESRLESEQNTANLNKSRIEKAIRLKRLALETKQWEAHKEKRLNIQSDILASILEDAALTARTLLQKGIEPKNDFYHKTVSANRPSVRMPKGLLDRFFRNAPSKQVQHTLSCWILDDSSKIFSEPYYIENVDSPGTGKSGVAYSYDHSMTLLSISGGLFVSRGHYADEKKPRIHSTPVCERMAVDQVVPPESILMDGTGVLQQPAFQNWRSLFLDFAANPGKHEY